MGRPRVLLFFLFAIAAAWLCILPFASSTGVFLSPDETAVYQAAKQFAHDGSMRLVSPYLAQFPWAHARSFVSQGSFAVPIGFIGAPLIQALFHRVHLPWLGLYVTPLLVLVVAYLFWRLGQRLPIIWRSLILLSWLTLPNVVLYANRSLFPNLITVCLTFMAGFLVWERRSLPRSVLAGACWALACIIRPIDIVWILPWVLCAWRFRQARQPCKERTSALTVLLTASLVGLFGAYIHSKTYGSLFQLGYFLRDPVVSHASSTVEAITVQPTPRVVNWLPFGIHPRHMWFNVKQYILGILWPWVLLACCLAVIEMRRLKTNPWAWLGIWTGMVCISIYGQGIYQDAIGVNVVSIGNSFLRYTLPLMVFLPGLVLLLANVLQQRKQKGVEYICMGLVAAMCAYGLAVANFQGPEAVQPSLTTLESYAQIQKMTGELVAPAIVFSDRSDKLFFAPGWSPVTPIPPLEEIDRFHAAFPDVHIYFFGRPLESEAFDAWSNHGYAPVAEFRAGNEVLYSMFDMDEWMQQDAGLMEQDASFEQSP